MPYRSDVDALGARHAALQQEVDDRTRELEEARGLLEAARARAKLPILDNIRVATPCRADWDKMAGDERTRACGACHKHVYNLSGMTRDEAESLIREREGGELCVRYFQRADGRIMLADCVVGVRRKRRRRVAVFGLAAAIATVYAGHALDQRGDHDDLADELDISSIDETVMGRMSGMPDLPDDVATDDAEAPEAPPAHISMELPQ